MPAATGTSTAPRWPVLLAVVAVGGALGSVARWGVSLVWSSPLAVLVVNVVGSLLLGLLMGLFSRHGEHPLVRAFVGVGVLGGFTTFSTAMVDARLAFAPDGVLIAVLVMLLTAFGSVAAAGAGWRLVVRELPGPR